MVVSYRRFGTYVFLKRLSGPTILRCVIFQKGADITYTAAEA